MSKTFCEVKRDLFDLVHRLPAKDSALVSALTILISAEYHKSTRNSEFYGKIVKPIPDEATESLPSTWRFDVKDCPVCGFRMPMWWMYDWKTDPSVPHHLSEHEPLTPPKRQVYYGVSCCGISATNDRFDYVVLGNKWAEAVAHFEKSASPESLEYVRGLHFCRILSKTVSYRESGHDLKEKVTHCLQHLVESTAVKILGEEVDPMMGTGTFGMEEDVLYLVWKKHPGARGATLKIDASGDDHALEFKCRVVGIDLGLSEALARTFLAQFLTLEDVSAVKGVEWIFDPGERQLKDILRSGKTK